jgi:predicted naringenin-chalcone synthase
MTLAIIGIGTAVPSTRVELEDALGIARSLACPTDEQETWLPSMYAGSGIRTRWTAIPEAVVRDVVDGTRNSGSFWLPSGEPSDHGPTTSQRMRHYAEHAPPLAISACRKALAGSGLSGCDFTHLVTVSCTGFLAPGIDRHIIEHLELPATIERTHVGYMGCHGALNGLRVARAFTAANPEARVLLCAVELCTAHYYYAWNPPRVVANALFADGAGAVVGVPVAAARADDWRVAGSGSCLIPDSADAMTWNVGDHGFEMSLAKTVPGLLARHVRPWLERWLSSQRLSVSEIRSWAVHPGGPRILGAVEEGLGLSAHDLDVPRAVLAEFGNMSSPTILFILERLRALSAPRPCVALGFGPGLTAEAALLL